MKKCNTRPWTQRYHC